MKDCLAIAFACVLMAESCFADDNPMYFETPSGNIFCTFNGSYLSVHANYIVCEIGSFQPSYGMEYARHTSDPIGDNPLDCTPQDLSRYVIYDGEPDAMNFCPMFDIVNIVDQPEIISETFVLDYSTVFSRGGISCSSKKSGLTCKNRSGHGFFLSKGQQQVF